jgi:hypothetical protein
MIGEMIWGDNNIFAENKLEALELDGVERERERERGEVPPTNNCTYNRTAT